MSQLRFCGIVLLGRPRHKLPGKQEQCWNRLSVPQSADSFSRHRAWLPSLVRSTPLPLWLRRDAKIDPDQIRQSAGRISERNPPITDPSGGLALRLCSSSYGGQGHGMQWTRERLSAQHDGSRPIRAPHRAIARNDSASDRLAAIDRRFSHERRGPATRLRWP